MRDMRNRNLNLQGYIVQRARDVVFALICAVRLRYTPAQIQELIDEVNAVLDKRRLPETWERFLNALERAARSGVVIDDAVLHQAFTEAGLAEHEPAILMQIAQSPIAPTKDRLQSLALAYVQSLQWKEAREYAYKLLNAIDSLDFDKAGNLLFFESLRLQQQMETGRTLKLLPETPAQLIAKTGEETPWIWRGIIPARHVVLLAGREKGRGGKSTLLFGLISHILQGKPFLERATTPQRILYISEETRDTVKDKLLAFGIEESPNLLLLTREAFEGGTHGALRRFQRDIEQLVEQYQVSLVIVDTLQSFAGFKGEGENRTGDIQAELAPVMSLSARGVGVIVVHHHNKQHGEPRGGTALTGAVDVIVNIARKGGEHAQNRRILEYEGRFGIGAIEYEYDPETATYHYHGTPEQAENRLLQQQILALLSDGEPLTEKQIREQVNAPQQRVSDALRALLNLNAIMRTGRGGKGDPYRYTITTPPADGDDSTARFFYRPMVSGDGKNESELNSGDCTALEIEGGTIGSCELKYDFTVNLDLQAVEKSDALDEPPLDAHDSDANQESLLMDDSDGACPPEGALTGDALIDAIYEAFPGAYELDGREKVEYRLQQLMHAPAFPLDPREAEQARAVWRLAESLNYPRLAIEGYAIVEQGESAWSEFLWSAIGTPAIELALEQLQQRGRLRNGSRVLRSAPQASLFGEVLS